MRWGGRISTWQGASDSSGISEAEKVDLDEVKDLELGADGIPALDDFGDFAMIRNKDNGHIFVVVDGEVLDLTDMKGGYKPIAIATIEDNQVDFSLPSGKLNLVSGKYVFTSTGNKILVNKSSDTTFTLIDYVPSYIGEEIIVGTTAESGSNFASIDEKIAALDDKIAEIDGKMTSVVIKTEDIQAQINEIKAGE